MSNAHSRAQYLLYDLGEFNMRHKHHVSLDEQLPALQLQVPTGCGEGSLLPHTTSSVDLLGAALTALNV